MNAHITTEEMHDLLDGLVPAERELRLRGHLKGCAACREELSALAGTLAAVRDLPTEATPPDGLWDGIQARMGAVGGLDAGGPEVVHLDRARRGGRRIALTAPQLAAAAVVVSLMSAGVAWMAFSAGTTAPPQGAAAVASTVDGPSARVVGLGETGYDEAVVQLRTIIDEGRDVLSTETLTTLETSLRAIDDAIAEVRAALETDPSSELLGRLLANHQRSKLRVLRQAAVAVQPRG